MTVLEQFGKDVVLSGWGHTRFGKLDSTHEELIVEAAAEAVRNAGIEASDIDEIFVGHFNSGMVPLAFPSSLALQLSADLVGVPATRVENACASGSAAFQQGVKSILAGTAKTVLVIGAEKMTAAGADVVGAALLGADYEMAGAKSDTGFAELFAHVADTYEGRYRNPSATMGSIAAKNHSNGLNNPYAHLRKDFGVDFCQTVSEKNPIVAGLLRRTDCSPVSDGAAAVVLTTAGNRSSSAATAGARLTGFGQANDFLPSSKRDPIAFAGSATAWQRAMSMAGTELTDLSFAEVHDCFTIAELLMYEVMGLTSPGEGHRAIEEGWVYRDGRFPVNVSGGLKSKGHPVGATGVSQHVIAAMQLTDTAGEMQLPAPQRAAVHNMGGLAVANYVSVLERI